MTPFEVSLVSAFGRGETLATALAAAGFSVRVLDFTAAFPFEYRRGPGPFPIALKEYLPEQGEFLSEATVLPRGLAFWLEDGPVELSGAMAAFYAEARTDVNALNRGATSADFKTDWLRRFLLHWASDVQRDSWSSSGGSLFPWNETLGLIPSYDEIQVMSFERFRAKGHGVIACQGVEDVHSDGSRMTELAVQVGGKTMGISSAQWVWCLSSRETEILNSTLVGTIFPKGVWRPDWLWVSFGVSCEHGPWAEGFPAFTVIVGDICLPWAYANMAVLRRLDPEGFRVWIKVPAKAVGEEVQRRAWAHDLAVMMNGRLSLAKWAVKADKWGVCPHSPVFEERTAEGGGNPPWKNWDWLAPEKLPRLDFSARLQAEALSFERLMNWRNGEMKKQGASSRDSALHTP